MLTGLGASAGGNIKGNGNKVWSAYSSEADKKDRELAEAWNGDSNSIFLFVSVQFTSWYPLLITGTRLVFLPPQLEALFSNYRPLVLRLVPRLWASPPSS